MLQKYIYSRAKTLAISSICFRGIDALKILVSDRLRAFWPISLPDFSQIWDLCWNTANNMNFRHRTNLEKINENFFLINSKTPILAHFPAFLRQISPPKNQAFSKLRLNLKNCSFAATRPWVCE